MSSPTILLSRQLPPPVIEILTSLGTVSVLSPDLDQTTLEKVTILLSTAVDPVSADMMDQLPNLGLIANIGVGTDNIDLSAAQSAGIKVSNTPVVTEDTADLTFALLMATCRKLSITERLLRSDQWAQAGVHVGTRVHGKSLGIIGFGDIGQAVARRAKGFNMDVHYHGPNQKLEAEAETGATFHPDLKTLLERCDIISVNCPLTKDTHHLLNAEGIARMKPGAILINTARGPIVDEAALLAALESGHLGGAGLDVFENEPEVNRALLDFDNVTLLPHIGSATTECRTDMMGRVLENIQMFLSTGTPQDRVI